MKTAVVLLNLGGPDRPEAVHGFLRNLFGDPAILRVPWPIRPFLASVIARRRTPTAVRIYKELGGGSPILAETERQASSLAERLADDSIRVFIAMRYWHPLSEETARAVKEWGADCVWLVPLYPQFSTTTTQSSLDAWSRAAARQKLQVPTRAACCFPLQDGFVRAYADLISKERQSLAGAARVLFSAHGLPERIVASGDPYVWQVEAGAAAIAKACGLDAAEWRVSYQSRVGPLQWVGPATDDEIRAAGAEGLALIIAPIAFVSEHSETLMELDIEYQKLAETSGVVKYIRVPAVGTHPAFIDGLADVVHELAARPNDSVGSHHGGRLCPAAHRGCPVAA